MDPVPDGLQCSRLTPLGTYMNASLVGVCAFILVVVASEAMFGSEMDAAMPLRKFLRFMMMVVLRYLLNAFVLVIWNGVLLQMAWMRLRSVRLFFLVCVMMLFTASLS